jgi:UDP-N-acetylglucosamine diphosphorylase / glucose-1-phosphate thymidylyltransferase / UDP-N-acetylgalactosamine diphosphorylase / glucosamine-1-phosphate N-acetyltransferase / galactosamine-1-phosphate N-acetyltransferase
MTEVSISAFIASWTEARLAASELAPWHVVKQAEDLLRPRIAELGGDYELRDCFAVHRTATIEAGVTLKGFGIISPRCLIGAGAYLRGGVFLGLGCTIGPAAELKSTYLLDGSSVAHLNFIGDSLIGAQVNIEAGAVIANHRNERSDKIIRIVHQGRIIDTGVTKFGAVVGDGARIGANSVIAPGALIAPGAIIGRLALIDQSPEAE